MSKPDASGYSGPDELYILGLDPKLKKAIERFAKDITELIKGNDPQNQIRLIVQLKHGKIGKANIQLDSEV